MSNVCSRHFTNASRSSSTTQVVLSGKTVLNCDGLWQPLIAQVVGLLSRHEREDYVTSAMSSTSALSWSSSCFGLLSGGSKHHLSFALNYFDSCSFKTAHF